MVDSGEFHRELTAEPITAVFAARIASLTLVALASVSQTDPSTSLTWMR